MVHSHLFVDIDSSYTNNTDSMPPSEDDNTTKGDAMAGKELDMEDIQLSKDDEIEDDMPAAKEEAEEVSTNKDQAETDTAKEEPSDNNSDNKNPEEEQYRQRCRRFYRQSTSVIEDDSAEEVEEPPAKKPQEDNRVVLEAVDKLSEQSTDAYASFLSTLSPKQFAVLHQCGLPTDADHSLTLSSHGLGNLIHIRTEERLLAHQVNMKKRLDTMQRILAEIVQDKEMDTTSNNTASGEMVTTRRQILFLQQTLRQFVHNYFDSVAAHSLLAGMRQCIELQLDQPEDDALCVCWKMDAAVISEAVLAQQEGSSARYMKDALQALLSFLVIYNNTNDEDGPQSSQDNNIILQKSPEDPTVLQLTLAMDPTLSDKTLLRIMQILPRVDELQARPTGQFDMAAPTASQEFRRTNVEGTLDQPMDVCTALVYHLKLSGWWWFC